MKNRPFYVVWCDGGGSPTVRHPKYASAHAEAERLAGKHPKRAFHVMKVCRTAVHDSVRWYEYEDGVDDYEMAP